MRSGVRGKRWGNGEGVYQSIGSPGDKIASFIDLHVLPQPLSPYPLYSWGSPRKYPAIFEPRDTPGTIWPGRSRDAIDSQEGISPENVHKEL